MRRERDSWPKGESGWSRQSRSWDGRWLENKKVGLRECISESSLVHPKEFFEVNKFIDFAFNMDTDLFGTRPIIFSDKN